MCLNVKRDLFFGNSFCRDIWQFQCTFICFKLGEALSCAHLFYFRKIFGCAVVGTRL